jgi:hypothetical protein
MNLFIIGFVFLSLLGSVMWVMPTKRDRFLAQLRMEAKRLGFQVQLLKLTYPRERGEMEPRVVSAVVYRLLRGKITQQLHNDWNSWRVVRCETNANEGLHEGWGWAIGERTMSEQALENLNIVLKKLPQGVYGLESTPVHVSAYWEEQSNEEMLSVENSLKQLVARII